ncbi:hypothetical protein GCM10009544_53570 [Streptomyces stramineus]|uniref:Uncharacterized protein n=1 Tax=Streptomyces stramineus TaxID=173861 RepID=A0ABN1AWF2_9ACTN
MLGGPALRAGALGHAGQQAGLQRVAVIEEHLPESLFLLMGDPEALAQGERGSVDGIYGVGHLITLRFGRRAPHTPVRPFSRHGR